MSLIERIPIHTIENKEEIIDLTSSEVQLKIEKLAEKIYSEAQSLDEITDLENTCFKTKTKYSLITHSAIKIAKSKKFLSEIKIPIHLTIVFPVFKEHHRIVTKEEHTSGEDFLIRKIQQLEFLFKGFDNYQWNMIVVDDGCPENSGKIAEQILKKRYTGKNVEVIFLQDAIDQGIELIKPVTSVQESIKGASIQYGMWHAIQEKKKNHIICYTDADLSTHLGQCGLLINSIVRNKKYAAIASRREYESVVLKERSKDIRGKLFIYIWKQMIRRLNYIIDSRCGFKAFRAEVIEKIIYDTIERGLAFDIELLLKTDLLGRKSMENIPIAWFDSPGDSTIPETGIYLDMLKSIAEMYHLYMRANAVSHKFAFFVKSLDQSDWEVLVNNVPEGIRLKSALHYDIYNEITVEDFMEILEKNKEYKQN